NLIENANDGVAPTGGSARDTSMAGDYLWSQPLAAGTANAIYMEDNRFVYTSVMDGAFDSYDGAKLVFRYNSVTGTNIGSHGLDSSGTRSTLLMEIYNNAFGNTNSGIYEWVGSRGGVHYVFNNTVAAGTDYSPDSAFNLRNYRTDNAFGYGNGAVCGGSNYIDGNASGQHGYPCRDQVGRGPETAPATDWPARTSTAIYSEALMPGYSWSNNFKGAAPTISNFQISNAANDGMPNTVSQYQIVNNRDFYNEVASFDGTAGVGSGLLSARPSTCTPQVAYWARDTNTLYQCSATNTWSAYYTPYTYPHPLQGTTLAPPTNVSVTVQ
ncbi:MAG: hypothetical protein WCC59_14470, partial [Terriglobales bacterium]